MQEDTLVELAVRLLASGGALGGSMCFQLPSARPARFFGQKGNMDPVADRALVQHHHHRMASLRITGIALAVSSHFMKSTVVCFNLVFNCICRSNEIFLGYIFHGRLQ